MNTSYKNAPDRAAGEKLVERFVPELGLTNKEIQRYSIFEAVRANATNDWSKAGFEAEVSRALEGINGRPARGFFMPYEALTRTAVSYAGTGDAAVGTDHEASSFIGVLRNRTRVIEAGATVLSGLKGNVDVPKLSSGATAYWLADETTDVTESLPALESISLDPHTVAAQTAATRRMRIQSSPDIEAMLQGDIRHCLATAIDLAALSGSGASGQPLGLLTSYTGVGSVVAGDGTNGAELTYGDLLALWREVAEDNADVGKMAFMTNPQLAVKLMSTPKVSSTDSAMVMENFDRLAGFGCYLTNQVPSGVTVGSASSCSTIVFGNWQDMLIGVFGTGLDLMVDDITLASTGGVTIRAFQDIDIKLRHPQSFAICEDAVDV